MEKKEKYNTMKKLKDFEKGGNKIEGAFIVFTNIETNKNGSHYFGNCQGTLLQLIEEGKIQEEIQKIWRTQSALAFFNTESQNSEKTTGYLA